MTSKSRDRLLAVAVAILLPAIIIAVEFHYRHIRDDQIWPVTASLLGIVAISLVFVFVATRLLAERDRQFAMRTSAIFEKEPLLKWISTLEQSVELERNAKEVWIFTHDFWSDRHDESVQEVVASNVKSGKRYVYLYPETVAHLANELRNKLEGLTPGNNVKFIALGPEPFKYMHFDVVLYDPLDQGSPCHKGLYTDLLRSRGNNSKAPYLDILLDREDSLPFMVNLLQSLIT